MTAAIYARVSTRDKGQTNDNQLRELRAFAERLGYTIYKEYCDQESGGTADRAQFQQVLLDSHQRRFDVVLFWSLDRFSREGVTETLNYLQKLAAAGVQFKSFTEQFLDSTGVFKDAIIGFLAAIAKQERVRLSERTKAGLARVRAKGQKLGRPTADKHAASIQKLRLEGKSDRAIARTLGISPSTVAKYVVTAG